LVQHREVVADPAADLRIQSVAHEKNMKMPILLGPNRWCENENGKSETEDARFHGDLETVGMADVKLLVAYMMADAGNRESDVSSFYSGEATEK
jgi:hypothetical protein